MTSLLTPQEVARLLKLSVRTIYANRQRLGGFYPAGIRALRFRREDIYAFMEGPQRKLEVPIPTFGPALQQDRVQNQGRGSHQHGVATGHLDGEPGTPATDTIDSITRDAMRYGLRAMLTPGGAHGKVPPGGRKKPGRGQFKKT